MFEIQQMFVLVGWNLYTLRKNPRFYMSMFLGFLLCWLLTDKTMALSRTYLTNIQLLEPFIWCYADADSILYVSLIMMFSFSAFPRMDTPASYMIFRTRRITWLLAQIATAFILTLVYCLMILLCSMVMCIGANVFFGNHWSETATLLSFSPESFEVALTVMRKTVKLTTPYGCAMQIFSLLFQYVLLLNIIQLCFTVLKSRKVGVVISLIVNFVGFALTPDRFMTWLGLPSEFQYYANLLSAWLSPLQHATYTMHNFGYDLLPRLWVSYLLFGGISAFLMLISAYAMHRFSFDFSGGYADEG